MKEYDLLLRLEKRLLRLEAHLNLLPPLDLLLHPKSLKMNLADQARKEREAAMVIKGE